MANTLLIDTDVLIEYLRGKEAAIEYLESQSGRLSISAFCVAELYAGARNEKETEAIDTFLLAFDFIAVDADIAKLGGQLRQKYALSHGTGLGDALVAATAITYDIPLVTFNVRHYPMLQNVTVPYGERK